MGTTSSSAYDGCHQTLNKRAAERKTRHDRNAKPSDLTIGTTVLLRNRVSGRNKIQDVWSMMPYQIAGQVTGNNSAYLVQRLSDSKSKIVNRVDMLEFETGSQTNDEHDKTEALSNDVSSSSEDEVLMMSHVPDDRNPEITHRATAQATRRSARTTAGKHSNPYNLPTSAFKQETKIQTEVHYSEFSDAICRLGKLLQESYDKN